MRKHKGISIEVKGKITLVEDLEKVEKNVADLIESRKDSRKETLTEQFRGFNQMLLSLSIPLPLVAGHMPLLKSYADSIKRMQGDESRDWILADFYFKSTRDFLKEVTGSAWSGREKREGSAYLFTFDSPGLYSALTLTQSLRPHELQRFLQFPLLVRNHQKELLEDLRQSAPYLLLDQYK